MNLFYVRVQDAEAALPVRHQSRTWCWCMCLGLALMLSGVMIGGVCLYHYYIVKVSSRPHHNWEGGRKTFDTLIHQDDCDVLCFYFIQLNFSAFNVKINQSDFSRVRKHLQSEIPH